MAKARYIVRMADGELFPWFPEWLKIPGMVEYDPAVHGIIDGVNLEIDESIPKPRQRAPIAPGAQSIVSVSEHVAGQAVSLPSEATVPKSAQGQATEPDLSDVFAPA